MDIYKRRAMELCQGLTEKGMSVVTGSEENEAGTYSF